MFDNVTLVHRDQESFAVPKFPWRDGIEHGPKAKSLPFGLFFQFLPPLAFRFGAVWAVNPGKAGPDKLFIQAFAPIEVDKSQGSPVLVFRLTFAVDNDRFYFNDSPERPLSGEFLCFLAEVLAGSGTIHAVKADPLAFAVMQDGNVAPVRQLR